MREWGGYAGIIEEARTDARDDSPLLLCPICGNILDRVPRGLNCDVGHFRAPAGARARDY